MSTIRREELVAHGSELARQLLAARVSGDPYLLEDLLADVDREVRGEPDLLVHVLAAQAWLAGSLAESCAVTANALVLETLTAADIVRRMYARIDSPTGEAPPG